MNIVMNFDIFAATATNQPLFVGALLVMGVGLASIAASIVMAVRQRGAKK